ncbi:MAG: beta-N-acetylhexosaminidase [Flavobacteriales bacterium]|nr:beta-N-acetylhexosaminidase [Flavobacteriales bacterium]
MKLIHLKFSFLFVVISAIFFLQSCDEAKVNNKTAFSIDRPLGSEIDVFWNLVENGYKGKSSYLAEFMITNNSSKTLDSTGWAIYFHQPRRVMMESTSKNISITHVNGDYFRLEPTASFPKLKKGEDVIVSFESDAWAIKDVDAPNGLFIVFSDSSGVESKPEVLTSVSYSPLVNKEQTDRFKNDPLPVPTAQSRYDFNKKLDFEQLGELTKIIPTPFKYEESEGAFELNNGLIIAFDKTLEGEANFLAEKLKLDVGIESKLIEGSEGDIVLKKGDIKVNGSSAEAYGLIVSNNGVEIQAYDGVGVFYGVQSLRALIAVEYLSSKSGTAMVPHVYIEDAPRFEYRGMHLDVVRNFSKKETVLNLIDLMAFYKLNKFHFHITDDEGWRLEIPGLPELTDVGSKRGYSKNETEMLNPAYGSGPHPNGDESWGTGHYTKQDFIEILKHAKKRHIEVIPELDFPGHARAAIVSMKARQKKLIAEGKLAEANEYILHDPNDASRYRSIQLYDDNVICVCQESTYRFLEKVTDEVIAMYEEAGLSLKQVHIGGDEVPHPSKEDPEHGAWKKSPKCNALLESDEDYENSEQLFYYFVDRFSKILEDRSIVTAGWEEIGLVKSHNEEGDSKVDLNEDFNERGFAPYVWNTVWSWGDEDRGYKLANAGFKVVLSNVSNNYFDLAYDKDPSDPGYYWGGFVDTKKAWEFAPLNVYAEPLTNRDGVRLNVKEDFKDHVRLTQEGKANIQGIQGQLWAETVKGNEMLEYYIFPKMLGLVERAWAVDPEWTSIQEDSMRFEALNKDWNQFASRIGNFELPRLTYLNGGVNYRVAPPGVKVEDGTLYVNTNYPGAKFTYTTDGTEPTVTSAQYNEPIAISGKQVRVIAFYPNGKRSRASKVDLTPSIVKK